MTEPQQQNALLVIDVQTGFDDPRWGRRNNPDCEGNIRRLIAFWRKHARPIVFVRHDSRSPDSPLFADSAGNAFKPEVGGEPDLLVVKHTNSAFYGTPDLRAWLDERGYDAVTVCGITTNHCCETTARPIPNVKSPTRPTRLILPFGRTRICPVSSVMLKPW